MHTILNRIDYFEYNTVMQYILCTDIFAKNNIQRILYKKNSIDYFEYTTIHRLYCIQYYTWNTMKEILCI